MNLKNILLMLACLFFIFIAGAGLYEHAAVLPRWTIAPPRSLSMLQGPYALNPGIFWRSIHPVALLFLIAALIVNWKTVRRKGILIVLTGYLLMLALTAIYFVPELIRIVTTPYSDTVDAALTSRAGLWEKLSLVRLVVGAALALVLLSCLTKPADLRHLSIPL